MSRVSLLAAASVAILSVAATSAYAQDREPVAVGTLHVRDEADFGIEPPKDDGYRAERTTTATRTETELRDIPQAITVITAEQIEDQAIDSMADAVLYVPGVTFAQGEGNRDAPVFRGNSSTSDFFVDGMRDDVQYFRDVYNVERIEVLKGPNAMIFGRGGAGGVINRVTRVAGWDQERELSLEAGADDHYRATLDLNQPLGDGFALRLTGLWQDSGSYRDGVTYERWALNPTASYRVGDKLMLTVGYEHFEDDRTADRGIPSFQGRPLDTDRSTFFGDPGQSFSEAEVDTLSAAIEYRFDNGLIVRNRTRWSSYDKVYQNVFPASINGAGTLVTLQAYNNATDRENLFNQTDFNLFAETGPVSHTLLFGFEFGRQNTDNLRNTGCFVSVTPGCFSAIPGVTTTNFVVPVGNPTLNNLPLVFAQSASDADNSGTAELAAVYFQDQIRLNDWAQLVVGVRWDNFQVDFRNNRTGATFSTDDNFVSPRLGLIVRPIEPVSVYLSYTKTFVPRAGEQLASLSLTNQALDPEEFDNYEVGVKWDANPDLTVTAALFQLDRSNVVVPDPGNPALSILVDGQRTRGFEVSAQGRVTERWSVIASYAHIEAEITQNQSATVLAGNRLPNAPENTLALWNHYDFTDRFAGGVGVIWQDERFAAADNAVVLPDFVRVDAVASFDLNENVRFQVNAENLLDEEYFPDAHNNNNITPAAGRQFKASVRFRY